MGAGRQERARRAECRSPIAARAPLVHEMLSLACRISAFGLPLPFESDESTAGRVHSPPILNLAGLEWSKPCAPQAQGRYTIEARRQPEERGHGSTRRSEVIAVLSAFCSLLQPAFGLPPVTTRCVSISVWALATPDVAILVCPHLCSCCAASCCAAAASSVQLHWVSA
jgi:hypothetical protein